jgi:hypothetical protein
MILATPSALAPASKVSATTLRVVGSRLHSLPSRLAGTLVRTCFQTTGTSPGWRP